MPAAIEITGLSKIYRLGEIGTGKLSRDIERWYRIKIRRQEDPYLTIGRHRSPDYSGTREEIYSLDNINLEIGQGEAFGIIGRNGAGKTTLLKIISRITSPSAGKIKLRGRVASLLEVGTGFHPELTGRENIYLNGTILGMRKNEILRKFDEIVDFSGVERFIDTPVRRYSSGMYVRLAFAVAAHLESEILIVDEVLAVGDADFQKKCLGKMDEVSKSDGRTVLFVSHNMGAIANLCGSVIYLEDGRMKDKGNVFSVIERYENDSLKNRSGYFARKPGKILFIEKMELFNEHRNETYEFAENQYIYADIGVAGNLRSPGIHINLILLDKFKRRVFFIEEILQQNIQSNTSMCSFKLKIATKALLPGTYSWRLAIHQPHKEVFDRVEDICPFRIIGRNPHEVKYPNFDFGPMNPSYEVIGQNEQ